MSRTFPAPAAVYGPWAANSTSCVRSAGPSASRPPHASNSASASAVLLKTIASSLPSICTNT
eukprot:1783498-Pyramimonas_sp.AAC.1